MSQPRPGGKPKVVTMSLKTRSTADGDECVRRKPAVIRESRGSADIIRLTNENAPGPRKNISIFIDPSQAADLFDPVPAKTIVLKPGESVDWTIKGVIDGVAAINFQTEPGNCIGQDQGDIEVRC